MGCECKREKFVKFIYLKSAIIKKLISYCQLNLLAQLIDNHLQLWTAHDCVNTLYIGNLFLLSKHIFRCIIGAMIVKLWKEYLPQFIFHFVVLFALAGYWLLYWSLDDHLFVLALSPWHEQHFCLFEVLVKARVVFFSSV